MKALAVLILIGLQILPGSLVVAEDDDDGTGDFPCTGPCDVYRVADYTPQGGEPPTGGSTTTV